MNNRTKKYLALVVVGLFLISFLGIVSAAEGSRNQDGLFVTLWRAFFGGMSFGGEGSWDLQNLLQTKLGVTGGANPVDYVAFFLLVFLVGMLIYDIAGFLPFFNAGWRKGVFSGIFAILAFLFFDLGQIKYLLSTYQAVGITLVAILPFIVIWTFVWNLNKKAETEAKPGYLYFGKMIWAFFGVYLLLRWVGLLNDPNPKGSIIVTAYLVLAAVALSMIFLQSKIGTWLRGKTEEKLEGIGYNKSVRNEIIRLENKRYNLIHHLGETVDEDEKSGVQNEINDINSTIKILRGSKKSI
jgi:hypothetical protein